MRKTRWDVVIVGGGAAGCLLANRLSRNSSLSVLLLEAGPDGDQLFIKIPAGWAEIAYGKRYNWNFSTQPEAELGGRRILWPRGKVLGGSTATNGMVYVRGQPEDFDAWAKAGAEGWDWQSVLPYFDAFEAPLGIANLSAVCEAAGELRRSKRVANSWGDRFVTACEQVGIPARNTYNDGEQMGAGYYEHTLYRGVRESAYRAFLQPVLNRANLSVSDHTLVDALEFEGGRAVAVRVITKGRAHRIEAGTVVLAGGAVGSPTILQRSGVGDAGLLASLGIDVVRDMPEVGGNLQDHYGAMVSMAVSTGGTVKALMRPDRAIGELWRYVRRREGLLAMPSADVFAFHGSPESPSRPDTQIHFTPASGCRDDAGATHIDPEEGITAITYPMRPTSRGRIQVASKDAAEAPSITANYLSTAHDQRVMVEGLKTLRRIFGAPAFKGQTLAEIRPGYQGHSDEDLLAYARENGTTGYHPVGTCRMGADPEAPVDTRLKLRHTDNVYVADASIMPMLVSGNTMAATYMIAERASEFIAQDMA